MCRYVETYQCTNPQNNRVKDSTRSFPSGHAALSVYAAMFLIVSNALSYLWYTLTQVIRVIYNICNGFPQLIYVSYIIWWQN